VAGLRHQPTRAPRVARPVAWHRLQVRGVMVAAAFGLAWLVTGWPAAGVLAASGVAVAPMLAEARQAREAVNERSDALASWAEMLRDTITAHAGLREAIALTAQVAPAAIRTDVQALAVQAEHEPLTVALRRFAATMADPVADLIVAALVIAADRQAQRLSELLSQIAAAAREQASMRLRVDTGRARTYASTRALVRITLALAVGLLVFSPTFMAPYRTLTGQLVLMGIGGLFAAALAALAKLSRPAVPPRLLAGIATDVENWKVRVR